MVTGSVFGHVERGHSGTREWRGHGGGRRVENLLMARSEWKEKSYGGWSRRGGGDGQSGRRKLMKRKARPKTFACVLSGGWYKLKEVSRNKMVRRSLPLAGVAAVFAAGLAVGYTLGKEQEINET
ncbi:hypothetical protein OsJ_13845 [Oryza sativa Japonica Group]|uniref:Uncharacterized protein n=1 Tax=Oryza sativa subsp. japonica TaxID=39947 RepID=A3AR49_ORYSJ|nr:hypothetical protein OsJ_13845 [Oryza sativa Japonica Group]